MYQSLSIEDLSASIRGPILECINNHKEDLLEEALHNLNEYSTRVRVNVINITRKFAESFGSAIIEHAKENSEVSRSELLGMAQSLINSSVEQFRDSVIDQSMYTRFISNIINMKIARILFEESDEKPNMKTLCVFSATDEECREAIIGISQEVYYKYTADEVSKLNSRLIEERDEQIRLTLG